MNRTNKKITWTLLELSGLLEEEDAHVHFERTTKHLALYPYHLINIQRGLNQILKSSLNNYDKELNGFVLAFKNPKVLSNFGELLYDSPFIHIDIEADFYLFRPKVGSFVKGIVNKKGLDHIVVLVHKIYTISIPKPDNEEEWIGDSVEVGQEIRCCINQVDNKCKPPFIRATLNSDYLQGCRLSDSIIIHNMENITDMVNDTESHNLNSIIKIEKTNDEISENDSISEKEKKKHRKKHKKSRDIDAYKNIKYEDNNTDSTIEGLNENSTVIIENSINKEDDTVSDKEKKKHRKKHKKSHEIASESFFIDQTKAESSNNTENDTYRYIKYEINSNTDSITESQNLNSTVKINTSINQTLENNTISEKEKRKYKKKHKKSHASDLESTSEDKNETTLNSNIHINIKCEDNVHNTNGAIESYNLEYLNNNAIKIDSWNGISDDAFSDKEKKKFRKKHKNSREIDPESISENKNEIKSNYNNTDSSIHKNIKCEDNIHNTNSAIENHNLDRVIKIENLTSGISEDATFDREKTKHRKKRKKSRETDTENETASDYLERCKKRKKTSTSPDSELKTPIKIKTEKFDSDLELKSPIKIKVEKV
ncbi:DNA-directed RNA polymerase I subunit RPA43 [Camponotus japonicus]